MAHKVKRGKCPYCGRTRALNKAGQLRKHPIKGSTATCGGSGHFPR